MTAAALSKREKNSARTREKLIDAAVELYGNRSIDAVSLREISVTAGQRNSNALQYHFCDRDGLLQAIIDKHACAITELRKGYIRRAEEGKLPPGEAAARALVMPIIDYVETTAHGINFVRVVSQIAALYQNGSNTRGDATIRFPRNEALMKVIGSALSTVPPREAQQRVYLVVNITFHTIADIYRAGQQSPGSPVAGKVPMIEQLILLLESFFCAPARHVGS